MKRILSLCLAVLLSLTGLVTLASCAKGDVIKVGALKKEIELEEYKIVYGTIANSQNVSTSFHNLVDDFAARLAYATGAELDVERDAGTAVDSDAPEILIGQTGRTESKKALKAIKGDGFSITVKGNKIVIVGSNALLTLFALDWFADNYLAEAGESGTLKISKKIKANNMPVLTLADNEAIYYTLICRDGLDNQKGNSYGEPGNNNDYDYPYQILNTTIEKLQKITNLPDREFTKKTDKADPAEREILFGRPRRDEINECLATIPGDGYGLFTKNGQVLVTSWSDTGLSSASNIFFDLLQDGTVTDEDGKVRVIFPDDLSITGDASDKWITDFTKPEGVPLYNTQEEDNDAFQYLYKGEGVNADAFRAYCEVLESEGYQLLCQNEIEQSLFATYVNEKKGHSLNVSYNAFIHGSGAFKYEPRLRVISTPLSKITLPDASILTPDPDYTKITDATITAIHLEEGYVGMGYVIMLEDGSFVIFDGGSDSGTQSARLYQVLQSLYKKAHGGNGPSVNDPIRIAAWIITHAHGDHTAVFGNFLSKYMDSGLVEMDYVMGNFPSAMTVYNGAGTELSMSNGSAKRIAEANGAKFIKIHTGERYYFANLEIEVLCTQEDLNPQRIDLFNDTSSTVRFTMTATDAEGNPVNDPAAVTTSIWTGDAFKYCSRYMSGMYGTYLESDMVQVAHHGNIGCEKELYGFIRPTVAWFPNTKEAYASYTGGWRVDMPGTVDYYLIHQLGTVRYVYISDTYNITVDLTASGPDYDHIYDAISGTAIEYNSASGPAVKK